MLLAGACVLPVFGQAPAPERREPTATVEFFALGPDLVPARDLKANELTFRMDGRPRTIKSLRLITLAFPAPADAAGAGALPPPPFGSNSDEGLGRSFIDRKSVV